MAFIKSPKEQIRDFSPKIKRRRVGVVREFPDGCGSHVSLMQQRKCEDGDSDVLTSRNSFVKPRQSFQNEMIASESRDTASGDEELKIDAAAQMDAASFIGDEKAIDSRERVKLALNLFHQILTNARESSSEGNLQKRSNAYGNDHSLAVRRLFEQEEWAFVPKQIGSIPGVEIGDMFEWRAELQVVGLHHQRICGIDYMEKDGKLLATSIVSSGRYEKNAISFGTLVYSGEGGNPSVGSKQADQKLERGNLALMNSKEAGVPIRVIYRLKIPKASTCIGANGKELHKNTLVYAGLYLVESYSQVRGQFGKLVFQFVLKKVLGQPNPIHENFLSRGKSSEIKREIVCANDISQGKENIPICCKIGIDEETPPKFDYITNVICPSFFEAPSPNACNRITGRESSKTSACEAKNGGTMPSDYTSHIPTSSPVICEVTPCCKCSFCCTNGVTQRGVAFKLEVFRTKFKRWGVRSRSYIRKGSFVCEYIGEVLHDKEVEKRINNSDCNYSFEGGSAHFLSFAQAGTSDVDNFTIDATLHGNVGRFIGHSCSPNLRSLYVLYDHVDEKVPRIMLLATKDIPALKELTIDYSYTMGKFGMLRVKPS